MSWIAARCAVLTRTAAACFLLFAVGTASAEDKVVNVYNWNDYITDDTLAGFTEKTGIEVRYDVYDSNDVLEAKLMAGRSGYDVVFPTATPYLAKQIQAGIYRPLDASKLPHAAGIDPAVLEMMKTADPNNAHAVPYMMAGTGVGYNVAKVRQLLPDAPIGSLAMIFDPAIVAKLAGCGVTVLDDPGEVLSAAQAWLGRDPRARSQEDLDAAAKAVSAVRRHWRYIQSSGYINDLANGAVCVSLGWGGDLVQARDRAAEAGQGTEIGIFLPREGAAFNIDVMAIPADAPHPDAAHAFIDYLLRPEVIGPITEAVGYANGIPAARAHVSAEILADPIVHPAADVTLYTMPLSSPEFERTRNRVWTRLKAGR